MKNLGAIPVFGMTKKNLGIFNNKNSTEQDIKSLLCTEIFSKKT
jgi:hypothetical protein